MQGQAFPYPENRMLKLATRKCDECLYSSNRIVDAERAKQIISETTREDRHFICHKATQRGEEVVCRGCYEQGPKQMIRIAQRLGVLVEVDPDTGEVEN